MAIGAKLQGLVGRRELNDYQAYVQAHLSVCDRCLANGGKLTGRCSRELGPAWYEFERQKKHLIEIERRTP